MALLWGGPGMLISWRAMALAFFVRRMPTLCSTGRRALLDNQGTVRADIPFRRAESKYAIEQIDVSVRFSGGTLSGAAFSNRRTVTQFARRAQLGELLDFHRGSSDLAPGGGLGL